MKIFRLFEPRNTHHVELWLIESTIVPQLSGQPICYNNGNSITACGNIDGARACLPLPRANITFSCTYGRNFQLKKETKNIR